MHLGSRVQHFSLKAKVVVNPNLKIHSLPCEQSSAIISSWRRVLRVRSLVVVCEIQATVTRLAPFSALRCAQPPKSYCPWSGARVSSRCLADSFSTSRGVSCVTFLRLPSRLQAAQGKRFALDLGCSISLLQLVVIQGSQILLSFISHLGVSRFRWIVRSYPFPRLFHCGVSLRGPLFMLNSHLDVAEFTKQDSTVAE